jgi:nucleotide-binding universal stress UspA family protein
MKMVKVEKILIAIDENETSRRAVDYVGAVAPHIAGVSVCLLHVYPEPPPDYYRKGGRLDVYQAGREERVAQVLQDATGLLVAAGVPEEAVSRKIMMVEGKTISQTVLDVQLEGGFDTVVAGKRGVSKAEEFLFGSISNTLARQCRDFTSWIVG